MSSKKPNEPNMPFGNIKIKQEPGTSTPSTSSATPSTSLGINNSIGKSRLRGFGIDRDLNLVSVKKEKLTTKNVGPNIANYQRRKRDDNVVVKQEPVKVRKERKPPTERVRGRGKAQTISLGIASEAPTLSGARRSGYRGGDGGRGSGDKESRASIAKPRVDVKEVINKEADEEVLKSIYKEFIDDGDDIISDTPLTLPVYPKVEKIKTEPSVSKKVKQIKKEDESEQKPVISENGTAIVTSKILKKEIIEKKPLVDLPIDPASVFENNEKQKNDYLLLVLPDSLPGLKKDDDVKPDETINDKKIKVEDKSSKENNDDCIKDDNCKLRDLNEGLIGKIQIHKSGKAYLKLGNNLLNIDVGSKRCFRQDLIAAKLTDSKNNLINLGPISDTIICSPSWETMLANLNNKNL